MSTVFLRFSVLVALPLVMALSCTKKNSSNQSEGSAEVNLVTQGKTVYVRHCIACHNANPKIDGAVGPAVYGSSLELLERRIVHGDYPPGYVPKKPSLAMQALPFLKDQIPALHAYLNSPL